ncbi:DUF1028 domain-containing protein [Leptolyngbya sp. AN02str]|uniref:DUF1028 domain-containing protein n=1 Tax=Leptolyngbya sp. AN02str TaxID=3423363 RepID=UPI003D315827
MTFSIVAWDPATQMTGVAVATKHLAVGALVPHVKSGVGAIATQGQTNPLLGIAGLRMLEQRTIRASSVSEIPVQDVVNLLMQDDEDREQRQLHLVDHHGHTAAWTGSQCVGWAGHLTFPNISVAGNMLAGEDVLVAMADAYISNDGMEFCDRLLHALEAGDAAGGDKRGRQSAGMYVMHHDEYPHLDLRVDHHDDPISTLRLLFTESRQEYYQSFRQTMPRSRSHSVEALWQKALFNSAQSTSPMSKASLNLSMSPMVTPADGSVSHS